MKKLIIFSMIALIFTVSSITIQADSTEPFAQSGNVFAYDSPYDVSFTYSWGPSLDQLKITISGNFSNVESVILTGVADINPLTARAIDYTSGTGMYARIENTAFYLEYDRWYDVMVFTPTITGDIDIYFFPLFSGGLTEAQLTSIIRNSMGINFNSIPNLQDYLDDLYNIGYERGASDYGIADGDDFLNASEWGDIVYDSAYAEGYQDGSDLNYNRLPFEFVTGLNTILSINLGGVTLGALVMIPISIGIFLWFIKISRK
jgi:hypothetical protein